MILITPSGPSSAQYFWVCSRNAADKLTRLVRQRSQALARARLTNLSSAVDDAVPIEPSDIITDDHSATILFDIWPGVASDPVARSRLGVGRDDLLSNELPCLSLGHSCLPGLAE
jgi:hypothetical protein